MTIGFFHIWRGGLGPEHTLHYVLGDLMIRSVRRVMPSVEIVHFTDETSPAFPGVDRVVRRSHAQAAILRIEHQIACEGDWLFCDTDMVFQRDVRSVFDEPFDIAIADRVGCTTSTEGEDYPLYQAMPHNSGMVFSRSPAFWQAVLHHMQTVPPSKKEWMGDQYAVNAVIEQGAFTVKILPGRVFNCPPLTKQDRCEEASIVHYKGQQRKAFMLDRFLEIV